MNKLEKLQNVGNPITTELQKLVDIDDPSESVVEVVEAASVTERTLPEKEVKIEEMSNIEKIKKIRKSYRRPVYPIHVSYSDPAKAEEDLRPKNKIKFGKLRRVALIEFPGRKKGSPWLDCNKINKEPEMMDKIPEYMWYDVVFQEPLRVPEVLFSEPDFPLDDYGCQAYVEFVYNSRFVLDMSIVFLKKRKLGKRMMSVLKPRIDFVIIAQDQKADEAVEIVRSIVCKYGEDYRYGTYYWNSVNIKQLKVYYHMEDPACILEFRVERIDSARRSFSKNGILEVTMKEYMQKEYLVLKGAIEYVPSPYFYTSRRGYRVQVNVWIRRIDPVDTKIRGVFFEICFLHGKFDSQLPRSFRHRTTVHIKRGDYGFKDIEKSVEMDIADQSSYFMFISPNPDLPPHLVGDDLEYKVVIEPAWKRNGKAVDKDKPKEGENDGEEGKDESGEGETEVMTRKKARRAAYLKWRREIYLERVRKRELKAQKQLVENETEKDGVIKVETDTGNAKSDATDDAKQETGADLTEKSETDEIIEKTDDAKQETVADLTEKSETDEIIEKTDDAKQETGADLTEKSETDEIIEKMDDAKQETGADLTEKSETDEKINKTDYAKQETDANLIEKGKTDKRIEKTDGDNKELGADLKGNGETDTVNANELDAIPTLLEDAKDEGKKSVNQDDACKIRTEAEANYGDLTKFDDAKTEFGVLTEEIDANVEENVSKEEVVVKEEESVAKVKKCVTKEEEKTGDDDGFKIEADAGDQKFIEIEVTEEISGGVQCRRDETRDEMEEKFSVSEVVSIKTGVADLFIKDVEMGDPNGATGESETAGGTGAAVEEKKD